MSNEVMDIHRSPDGALWFGAWGASRYDGEKFVNFTTDKGLISNHITSIDHAPNGALWFAGFGRGVSCYDGEKFLNYTMKDGLAHMV